VVVTDAVLAVGYGFNYREVLLASLSERAPGNKATVGNWTKSAFGEQWRQKSSNSQRFSGFVSRTISTFSRYAPTVTTFTRRMRSGSKLPTKVSR
jgi:hypothetical protein